MAVTGVSGTFSGAVTVASSLAINSAAAGGSNTLFCNGLSNFAGAMTISNGALTAEAATFSGQLTLQNDDATLRVRSNTTTTKGVTLRYNHAGNFGELRSDQAGVNQLDMKYYALTHKFGRNDSLQYLTISDTGAATFSGSAKFDGGIKDKNNSTGSASHVLHSDGVNRVYWTTAPSATIPGSVTNKYYTYVQLTTAAGDYYTITHSLGESDVVVAVRRAISGTATRSERFAADAGVHLDVGYDVQVTSCDANGAASSNHVSLHFDNYSIVNNEYVYVTVIG